MTKEQEYIEFRQRFAEKVKKEYSYDFSDEQLDQIFNSRIRKNFAIYGENVVMLALENDEVVNELKQMAGKTTSVLDKESNIKNKIREYLKDAWNYDVTADELDQVYTEDMSRNTNTWSDRLCDLYIQQRADEYIRNCTKELVNIDEKVMDCNSLNKEVIGELANTFKNINDIETRLKEQEERISKLENIIFSSMEKYHQESTMGVAEVDDKENVEISNNEKQKEYTYEKDGQADVNYDSGEHKMKNAETSKHNEGLGDNADVGYSDKKDVVGKTLNGIYVVGRGLGVGVGVALAAPVVVIGGALVRVTKKTIGLGKSITNGVKDFGRGFVDGIKGGSPNYGNDSLDNEEDLKKKADACVNSSKSWDGFEVGEAINTYQKEVEKNNKERKVDNEVNKQLGDGVDEKKKEEVFLREGISVNCEGSLLTKQTFVMVDGVIYEKIEHIKEIDGSTTVEMKSISNAKYEELQNESNDRVLQNEEVEKSR